MVGGGVWIGVCVIRGVSSTIVARSGVPVSVVDWARSGVRVRRAASSCRGCPHPASASSITANHRIRCITLSIVCEHLFVYCLGDYTHKQTRVKPGLRATRFTYCKLLRAYCQAFSDACGVAMPRPAIDASTRPRSGRTGPRSWSRACRAILRAVPVDGLRQGSLPSFAEGAGGQAGSVSLWRDPR